MTSDNYDISAHFLEHEHQGLFYLLLEPADLEIRGSVLFLPPFAEELNVSRRLVACQARVLAAAGYRVMLLDPTGCGDGGGEFVSANWRIWLQDANTAADVLAKMGSVPIFLWGLRLGALLACELSQLRSDISRLVLWQPVLNGEQQIDQFLRIETAASAMKDPLRFDRKMLWKELRSGKSVEVAGYELSSEMALEIAKTRLADLTPTCSVAWVEIGYMPGNNLSIASQSVINRWRVQGLQVYDRCIQGEPFWRTIGSEDNLELQQVTLEMLVQE